MTRRRILRALAGLASALALPGLWKRQPQVQYDATGKPIVNSLGEPFLEDVPDVPMYTVRSIKIEPAGPYDPCDFFVEVLYTFEITNGK